jgi:hypothetical protein
VIAESRLGGADQRSTNPQARNPFEVWFNCSSEFLKNEIERRKAHKYGFEKYVEAKEHFAKVEKKMSDYDAQSGGALKVRYLVDDPLVLDLAA